MSKFLFVTGTGTDVGKTYVSALIIKKLHDAGKKIAYFKPAMSGNNRDAQGNLLPGDALFVKNFAKIPQKTNSMCPYVFAESFSPHLAAQLNQVNIKKSVILHALQKLEAEYDYILIEGAGGVLCPLSFGEEKFTVTDFIVQQDLPCLVIADAGLGTINNLALTIEYLKNRQANVLGFMLNNFEGNNILHENNLKMCELMTNLESIACIQKNSKNLPISAEELSLLFR